jgi:hypothetical protein
MADTAIEITAGTGTNVDTRTEGTNGNHRQVVVLGDPATNAGVAPVDATNGLAVQIIPALPAGTNAIGKLAANSGVDIGDVDVASCALPTGAATSAKQLADGHNVVVASGTALIGKVGIDQATANANEVVVKSGTVTTVSTVTNLSQLGGQAVSMGTGTRDAGTQRVTIATNDAVPVTFTDQKIDLDKVAGASVAVDNGTAATSIRVTVASDSTGQIKLAAGTAEIGKLAAGTAEIGKLAAGVAEIGNVKNSGTFAVQAAATLGTETTKVIGTVNIIGGQTSITAGAGAVAANTPRVTHASDDPVTTSVQLIDDAIIADDAAFTPATSKVMMAGFEADETGTDSVDEGDAGAARMTLDRKQIVTIQPHTQGGLSAFFSIDLDESEEDIKGTAGQIYGWYFMNLHSATLYLRFYNATAANTTVGTTAAIMVIPVPAGAAANVAFPNGIAFDTALCAAVTTGIAANDTGAPAANVFVLNLFYK